MLNRKYIRYAAFVISGLVMLSTAWLSTAHAQKPPARPMTTPTRIDLSTPEAALVSYAAAIGNNDWDNAVRCLAGVSTSRYTEMLKSDPEGNAFTLHLKHISVKPAASADSVTATFIEQIEFPSGDNGESGLPETLKLRKGPTGWQILPVLNAGFFPRRNMALYRYANFLAYPEASAADKNRNAEARGRNTPTPEDAPNTIEDQSGVRPGQTARLSSDGSRRSVYVAQTEAQAEVCAFYVRLKHRRVDHPKPFLGELDCFSDEQYDGYIQTAKGRLDRLTDSGAVRLLPSGPRVRILARVAPIFRHEPGLDSQDAMQTTRRPSDPTLYVWKIRVLGGRLNGQILWTCGVHSL